MDPEKDKNNGEQLSNEETLDSSLEATETSVEQDSKKATLKQKNPLKKFQNFISHINIYLLLFIFIIIIAGIVSYVSFRQSKKESTPPTINTTPLDPSTLDELKGSDAKVGDPKSTLSVESNAIFAGKVLIRDSLDVAGTIRVGGALSLPGITVSGTSNFDQIQANNLAISGDVSIQGQLTVQKGLTVSGGASFSGAVSAPRIIVDSFTLNQDLQLNRHIDSGGPTPNKIDGNALGGGGTVSISGTDTSGTVTINTGGGPSAGCFVTIQFANKFGGNPHTVITPIGLAAATLQYYATRSATEMSICTATPAPPSSTFSFDYIVID